MLRICGALIAPIIIAFSGPLSASELHRETFASTALARDIPSVVYVPDGYQSSGLHYPVLYLLHGVGGDEYAWVERGNIQERSDRLIVAGSIPPTLIVMPGCRACWWIDGAKDEIETAFETIVRRRAALVVWQEAYLTSRVPSGATARARSKAVSPPPQPMSRTLSPECAASAHKARRPSGASCSSNSSRTSAHALTRTSSLVSADKELIWCMLRSLPDGLAMSGS